MTKHGKAFRSFKYLLSHKNELFSMVFLKKVFRVLTNRFVILNKVSKQTFNNSLSILEERPWNLHIEVTNRCNANCIFCAYKYQSRKKVVIDDSTYLKALNDYCDIGGGELMLEVVVGDPCLDSKLVEKIEEARRRPEISSIKTITNGIGLDRVGIEKLLKSGISCIQISTGPWQKELYEEIYKSQQYDKMKANVEQLLIKNQEFGSPVEIIIAFRTNMTMQETLRLPDYQKVKKLSHSVDFNTDFDTWRGRISKKDLLPGMQIRPPIKLKQEACYWLFDGPIVFSNGDVGMCGCRDFNADSELIIGNINDRTLLDIWQSEKVHELRTRFKDGKFPDICNECSGYADLTLYRTKMGAKRAQEIESRFLSAGKKRKNHI